MDHQVKLPSSFYQREDVALIAQELLGKLLVTFDGKSLTGGFITETEAYGGITDKACHAYNGRFTPRTKTLYEEGGISYVYFCYGMHHLLNVVTNKKGIPEAVLIRGIQPVLNIPIIKNRMGLQKETSLIEGPGRVCKALNITLKQNGISLLEDKIWIEDRQIELSKNEIAISTRIGIDYAGKDAKKPWRFFLKKPLEINTRCE